MQVYLLLGYSTGKSIHLKIYTLSVIKMIRLGSLSFSSIHSELREQEYSLLDSTAPMSFDFGDDLIKPA